MPDFSVAWIATGASSNAVGIIVNHNMDVSFGSVVVAAHSEMEAEGAVARVVADKFPTRRVSVNSHHTKSVPCGQLAFQD